MLSVKQFQRLIFGKSENKALKVSVLGAAGATGKSLSLLLKHSDLISDLHLYDIRETRGMACDLSHIETSSEVKGFTGPTMLRECLKGSDIVIMTAGRSWHQGITYEKLLEVNGPVVRGLAEACADVCPTALIAVLSRPINSLVPLMSEVFIREGVYNPRKIFGISTLNVVRANTFIAKFRNMNPAGIDCPVIGGNSGTTIVPLISQTTPQWGKNELSEEALRTLTSKIQFAGKEVVKANIDSGATLSAAYAAARFTNSIIRGLTGDLNIIECAYVRTDIASTKYFAGEVHVCEEGVEEVEELPQQMTAYEAELLENARGRIQVHVEMGEKFLSSR